MQKKILVLAGPTASGKSALALSIAQNSGGVIINADSQQMYRELRILTARPAPEEESRVPHKLYGAISASESCSAGLWLRLAKMEIDWALAEGKLPIAVGGTGLYLKALLHGIAEIPAIDAYVRTQAIQDYEAMGKEAFAARLREADPAFFARLKVYDRQRLIRAYEVWLGTGKPLSYWQNQEIQPAYPAEYFSLWKVDVPREALYQRCNERFIKMMAQGAVEEVKALLMLNLPAGAPAMKSLGVKELAACLRNTISLEEAIALAQQATRNYAKRQLTWFRHQLKNARLVDPAAPPIN